MGTSDSGRRAFLASAVCATAATISVPYRRLRFAQADLRGALVPLDGVAIGMGPILATELTAGCALSVRVHRGRQCVFLRDQLLGWLPEGANAAIGRAFLADVRFDEAGRMRITMFL